MKTLLIATAAASLLAVAQPAEVSAQSDMEVLARVLDSHNIPYRSKTDAYHLGMAVCIWFASGYTVPEVAVQLTKDEPRWDLLTAGEFAGAATGVMCPKYLSKGRSS